MVDSNDDALANALLQALGQGELVSDEPELDDLKLLEDVEVHSEYEEFASDSLAQEPVLSTPALATGAGVVCPSCQTENAPSNRYCGACGASLVDVNRRKRDIERANRRFEVDVDIALVAINEDGTDGMRIPLRYNETVIGRSGDTRFPTDSFLSPQHALLIYEGGHLFIEDMYSLNGTYLRIKNEIRLSPGDCFLMGRQVLRFERFEQTVTPKARAADGTRYMGSPPPGGDYKILQVGIGGNYQNVYCLPEAGAVLGREKGDIVFPRDRFMSGRHAQVYPRDDGFYYLVDLNSSNGTWTKIWERNPLEHGDLIFLGQQLFRVEAPDLV